MDASMDRYRYFDHTADAEFEAYGATLEEAFVNAALALAGLMWDWESVKPRVSIPVRVEGRDLEQLLYMFLAEALYLLDTRSFLLAAVENLSIAQAGGGWKLEGTFVGDDDLSGYDIAGGVKAVTYNNMRVERGPSGVRLRVVVDR